MFAIAVFGLSYRLPSLFAIDKLCTRKLPRKERSGFFVQMLFANITAFLIEIYRLFERAEISPISYVYPCTYHARDSRLTCQPLSQVARHTSLMNVHTSTEFFFLKNK